MLTALLLLAALAPAPAAPAGAAEPLASPPPVTLRYFNRDIVTLRASSFGVPPAGRAAQGVARIREALAKGGPGAVAVLETPEGLNVTVDGLKVFRVLRDDLDLEDGQTFDEARATVGPRLTAAIAAARQSKRGRELVRESGLALAATCGFLLILWVLFRARMWIRRRIDVRLRGWLGHLGRDELAPVVRLVRGFGSVLFVALVAVLVEEWLRFVFGLFPYTRPWAERLTGYIGGIIGQVVTAIVAAVPGLVMVAVIAGLARLAVRVLRVLSRAIEMGRFQLFGIDKDVLRPARQLTTAAIWLFALALAYPYIPGSGSEAFKGLSVLVGVMLSLGASGRVGHATSGFILTFSRILREGDWVRVGDAEGAVTRVGLFTTKIRTFADEEISLPNGLILDSVTRNFSRPAEAASSILETAVTIGYGAPWRQVHALLLEAAARTPDLEREPAPRVLQTGLSDFYVQYTLQVRLLDQLRRPAVLSALNANIQDLFNEYGVQIMSPHYLGDPSAPAMVPKERWYEAPAVHASQERPR
ncbi:MAG TPA: mechanosensitive ion channel domain-containing protein [Thermoanaerobaculia bacterium]